MRYLCSKLPAFLLSLEVFFVAITLQLAASTAAGEAIAAPRLPAETVLTRVAFGSCAKAGRPQPVWDAIRESRPDLFLFLGDTVYPRDGRPATLRAAYDELQDRPGYAALRRSCPILAVWDDHDYGLNDGGAEHPHKAAAQREFLESFGEPRDSPRWGRAGLYGESVFGPAGKRVQLIVLDTRYHRSRLRAMEVLGRGHIFFPENDPAATMLGEEQWRWLEAQLAEPADVRLVASTVQVLPIEHPFEKWSNLPRERERLIDALDHCNGGTVIVLSGDQHMAELNHLDEGGREVLELTSSSLTHTRPASDWPNRYRVGGSIAVNNFGEVAFDWAARRVTLRIVDERGGERLRHEVAMRD